MPIIINDFEILVEEPERSRQSGTDTPPAPRQGIGPDEILRVERRQRERMARVRAT